MPKIVHPKTAMAVNKLKIVGFHAVGGVAGLGLQIRQPTSKAKNTPLNKSWILRVMIGNKRVLLGLGSFQHVSLAQAREDALKMLTELKNGGDPRTKKKALKSAMLQSKEKNKTFKDCAKAYMTAHVSDYRSEKHRKQWASTIEAYAYPLLGALLVAEITMQDVLRTLTQPVINPITNEQIGTLWTSKNETAKRLQGRIKSIFDYAIVSEYRTNINPANWTGYLSTQLPKPSRIQKVEHHPAIPYNQIGNFMTLLRSKESMGARALEFLVLTAVRSGSVRDAEWSEIDFENKVWNIPAEHTKMNKPHRVPLPSQAIKLLKSLPVIKGKTKIFPSPRGVSLSDNTLSKLMRDMRESGELKVEGVPHGFRSTFRDWSAEKTYYPEEIRKVATMHEVGDETQQAYQRTDLLEKRRNLMNEWANFLDKPSVTQQTNGVQLRRKVNA
jgi:integrase